MSKQFYYVTQENLITKKIKLLGFNLTKEQKDKLAYSLGKYKNSSLGSEDGTDIHLRNAWGGHKKEYKNKVEARTELVDKPNAFNEAMETLKKYGYVAVKKGIVHNKQIVQSYQMEFEI